jgi:hypothetical protein
MEHSGENPHSHYPMPHIINMVILTKLDTGNFTKWRGLMKTHISSASLIFGESVKLDLHVMIHTT